MPHQRVAPEKYQLIIGREIAMHYAHLNKRLIFELVCSKNVLVILRFYVSRGSHIVSIKVPKLTMNA